MRRVLSVFPAPLWCSSVVDLSRGTKSGKQHCGLRTKALLQGLRTRADCRLRDLTSREKLITTQRFRTGDPQISSPRFSHCVIVTAGGLTVKLWFLSPTDFPSYRPRLLLLKPEGEGVELWPAKISV